MLESPPDYVKYSQPLNSYESSLKEQYDNSVYGGNILKLEVTEFANPLRRNIDNEIKKA